MNLMKKEWLKELQENRRVIWLCRLNQRKKEKAKEAGMATKAEEATTIRLVKISKKEISRIRENLGTKVTKGVVLQVKEKVVVKSQTRVTFSITIVKGMVTILVIVKRKAEESRDLCKAGET